MFNWLTDEFTDVIYLSEMVLFNDDCQYTLLFTAQNTFLLFHLSDL